MAEVHQRLVITVAVLGLQEETELVLGTGPISEVVLRTATAPRWVGMAGQIQERLIDMLVQDDKIVVPIGLNITSTPVMMLTERSDKRKWRRIRTSMPRTKPQDLHGLRSGVLLKFPYLCLPYLCQL